MSYEITTVAENKAKDGGSNSVSVLGREDKAKYAIYALKNQITNLLVNQKQDQSNIRRYDCAISKQALLAPLPEKKFGSFKEKLNKIFNGKYSLDNEELIGVDITPSCIYVCQIDNNGNKAALTGLASVCVEGKFINEDILKNPDLYSANLKKLVANNKLKSSKVAVSLPVSSSVVRVATISKMCDEDITRAIKYGSLWQNIMGAEKSPNDYSIFYQVIRREDSSNTMDILLVATKLSDINLYKNIITKSGLDPVIIDAKTMALHYAFKSQSINDFYSASALIEFGLENNYIMVMSGTNPRIFSMDISSQEHAAILGIKVEKNEEIVTQLIQRYRRRLENIIAVYKNTTPSINIKNIYVTSSSPLLKNFITRLNDSLDDCTVKECCMFDYINIPDNFEISKQNAKNNISAWASAIAMAIMPWQNQKEEWIEVRKSPIYGTEIRRHYSKFSIKSNLAFKIGEFDPYIKLYKAHISFVKRFFSLSNFVVIIAGILANSLAIESYFQLKENQIQIDSSIHSVNYITKMHEQKTQQISKMQNTIEQMEILDKKAIKLSKDDNQKYILSIYNYLDTVLHHAVWLKQLNFIAPYHIKLEGRAVTDENVVEFLKNLNRSDAFSQLALRHMQSISEMDLYTNEAIWLKSFVLKGNLASHIPYKTAGHSPINESNIGIEDFRYVIE